MPMHVGISGNYKEISDVYAVISNSNKMVTDVYVSKDGSLVHTHTSQGEKIFTTSGSFKVPGGVKYVDMFLVGGGGGGGTSGYAGSGTYSSSGCGGGGGYTTTVLHESVTPGQSYTITIGAGANFGGSTCGGGTYALGHYAYGGWCGCSQVIYGKSSGIFGQNQGNGGSGGGIGGWYSAPSSINLRGGGCGGSDGSNGYMYRDPGVLSYLGQLSDIGLGVGQGTTTKAFGDHIYGTLYSGGGGGGTSGDVNSIPAAGGAGGGGLGGGYYGNNTYMNSNSGTDGSGGGGGGYNNSSTSGNGGSGICIIRWGYDTSTESFSKRTVISGREFMTLVNNGLITKEYIGKDVLFETNSGSYYGNMFMMYRIEDINHPDNGSATDYTVDLFATCPLNFYGTVQFGPDSDSAYTDSENNTYYIRYRANNIKSDFPSYISGSMRKMSVPCFGRNKLKQVFSLYVKIPSLAEIGYMTGNTNIFKDEGTTYPRFNQYDTRFNPSGSTSGVRSKYKFCDETNSTMMADKSTTKKAYWTRTCCFNNNYVYYVSTSGSVGGTTPTNDSTYMIAPVISFNINKGNEYNKAKTLLSKSQLTEEEFFFLLERNMFTTSNRGKEIVLNIDGYDEKSNTYVIANVNHMGIVGSVDLVSKYIIDKIRFGSSGNDIINNSTNIMTWINNYYKCFSNEARSHMTGTWYKHNGTMYRNNIIIPSGTELGLSDSYMNSDGEQYPTFNNNTTRLKTDINGNVTPYWTRSAYTRNTTEAYTVSGSGSVEITNIASSCGIMPLIRFF